MTAAKPLYAEQKGPARRATWHDAFDAQMGLWRWMRHGEPGEAFIVRGFEVASEGLRRDTAEMQARLWASVPATLLSADPIFVSDEMCELVEAARGSFDPEPLFPTDLICSHGFVYFETPFTLPDKRGEPMRIAAFSWAPVFGSRTRAEQVPGGADVLDYFKGRDYTELWAEDWKNDDNAGQVDGIVVTLYAPTEADTWATRHGAPGMVPVHVTPWWFGMTFDGNEEDENGEGTGAEWWWRLTQTTLRLMQQTLAVRTKYRPDRPTRRNAQRRGFVEREITVVRLRREHNQNPDAPHTEANYSHRFIVSGHWRSQWYPGSGVHRQIWISPYIKGSEHLPLMVKPRKVYTWVR